MKDNQHPQRVESVGDNISRKSAIDTFPSVQPETHEKRTETHERVLIDRQQAIDALGEGAMVNYQAAGHDNGLIKAIDVIKGLPSAEPEIIRCKDCKHNPKYEWFGCPMSHLSEAQRPETAWCWKAERRTGES